MCDATHHKPFGSGSEAGNEVRRLIVYILDDKMFLFYQWLYYKLWIMDL